MSYPQQPPQMPRRYRSGSLGCLGILSLFCMFTCTGLNLAAGWWVNPAWLDKVAFWRSKPYAREEVTWDTLAAGPGNPTWRHGAGSLEPIETPAAAAPATHFGAFGGATVTTPAPLVPGRPRPAAASIAPGAFRFPPGTTPVSVVSLSPDGARFNPPVTVTMPLNREASRNELFVILTREGNTWVDEGVTARASGGKSVEVALAHFSEHAAVDAPWDPNFIKRLQQKSLLGIEKVNKALELINNNVGRSFTPAEIDSINNTDTSEAIKLLDDLDGWVEKANPAFHNFLLMSQLSQGSASKWETYKTYGKPTWTFIKEQYFTPQTGEAPEPALSAQWKARLDEAKESSAVFEGVFKVYFRHKKEAFLAQYGVKTPEELAAKLLENYFKKKGAEQQQRDAEEVELSPGGFVLNNKTHALRHPRFPSLTLSVDFFGDGGERDAMIEHARRTMEVLRGRVPELVRAWEWGQLGSGVSPVDLQVLANYLAGEAKGWVSAVPAEGQALQQLCEQIGEDMGVKYLVGDPPRWTDYASPHTPDPGLGEQRRLKSGSGLEIDVSIHESPLDSVFSKRGKALGEKEFLRISVPEGYEVMTTLGSGDDDHFDRLNHKTVTAYRIVPPKDQAWRVDIAVRPKVYSPRAAGVIHVRMSIENEDPFVGDWTGWLVLKKGSLAEPLGVGLDRYLDEMDKKTRADIASDADPARRTRSLAEWEQQKRDVILPTFTTIKAVAKGSETVARFPGVPIEFHIDKDAVQEDVYQFRITRAAYKEVTGGETVALRRVGEHTLAFPAPDEKLIDPLLIRLTRPDEVSDTYTIDQTLGTAKIFCRVQWTFERKGAGLAGPPAPGTPAPAAPAPPPPGKQE